MSSCIGHQSCSTISRHDWVSEVAEGWRCTSRRHRSGWRVLFFQSFFSSLRCFSFQNIPWGNQCKSLTLPGRVLASFWTRLVGPGKKCKTMSLYVTDPRNCQGHLLGSFESRPMLASTFPGSLLVWNDRQLSKWAGRFSQLILQSWRAFQK